MGVTQRRKKMHHNKKLRSNDHKTRRFNANQMPDQIYDDIKLGRKNVLPVDFDLPANGQIYCVSCAKYFKNDEAIARHNKSKLHKRLLKVLQEEPHRGEALPIDNGPLYGAAAME